MLPKIIDNLRNHQVRYPGGGNAAMNTIFNGNFVQAVFLALLQPGDTVLGMALAAGGHLTHGARPNLSGKWFNAITYGVRREDGRIDFDEVERLAEMHRPRLIIAGGSAYSRIIDFARFRAIADRVGAYLMVDMAHFAGLVAGDAYPTPLPHAHIVTTTTHKTLRGPRGGLILANDEEIGRRINAAVFPGLQGGPLMHVIAAKAVALREASQPAFRQYASAVVANAKALAATLEQEGLEIVSGGTDTHLMLVDLRDAEKSLEQVGITCNKNGVPFDPEKPTVTSGVRLGSPAATTRGFGQNEFQTVGRCIVETLHALRTQSRDTGAAETCVRAKVRELCTRFPIYPKCGELAGRKK